MKKNDTSLDQVLDRAVESVRQQEMEPSEIEAASKRVQENLYQKTEACSGKVSRIRGCGDLRRLIPDYLDGRLPAARRMLLEDHVSECLPCRRALTAARTSETTRSHPLRHSAKRSPWLRWGGIAAGLILVAVVGSLLLFEGWPASGASVELESVSGLVQSLNDNDILAASPGSVLDGSRTIRTGKASGAILRLADGSRVEMDARTELKVLRGWGGTTVRLGRGNVIVQAADQKDGKLYVSTNECRVAVKGTVFSVSRGMKGSRVSVIEGEVWVEQKGESTVLEAGEQYASQAALTAIPVAEEIAWSQNAEDHLALLKEFSKLHKDLRAASFGENLRFSTSLAGYLPSDTVVYGAFPNLSGRLDEIYATFQERVEESPALKEWYGKSVAPEEETTLLELMEKVRALGGQVGDEVVLALINPEAEEGPSPVLLALVKDRTTLEDLIQQEADRINAESEEGAVVMVTDDPSTVPETTKGVVVWVGTQIVAASPSPLALQRIAETQQGGESFVQSRFYQTIAARYDDGVDWLFSVDMERLLKLSALQHPEQTDRAGPEEAIRKLGVSEVRDLVIERKQGDSGTQNRAVLTYDPGDSGHGLLSWIAAPGPMGALDFVSQDANLAAAFVIRDPAQLVDDLFQFLESSDPQAWEDLVEFQLEHGLDIREDMAAPLGGEVVFALDGPVLPTPSWKVVVEVYDPARLQKTLEWMVAEVNDRAADEGRQVLSLESEDLDGQAVYTISFLDSGSSFQFQYMNGYLIAAPTVALISKAIQYRSAGYSLVNDPGFESLLPRDKRLNMSGMFYHNLAPLLGSLVASGATEMMDNMDSEARASLEEMVGEAPPLLISLYSEPGQVTVSSSGDLESLWLNMGTLASLGGPRGLAGLMSGAVQ